ncbi:hypothetical protein AA106556_1817 [Neokomagataea tanensis NBRC 106556]|uniref:Uncharacterized protein n=1 Tax=Neokomagataea tanensis NBRC 106556 TaxID=1223519 RepID=A0ABQ0QKZ1_9PROT|nr:hypothetical protein AA106556_1817 [Neokomagataea tanensis NBRC 106556]
MDCQPDSEYEKEFDALRAEIKMKISKANKFFAFFFVASLFISLILLLVKISHYTIIILFFLFMIFVLVALYMPIILWSKKSHANLIQNSAARLRGIDVTMPAFDAKNPQPIK